MATLFSHFFKIWWFKKKKKHNPITLFETRWKKSIRKIEISFKKFIIITRIEVWGEWEKERFNLSTLNFRLTRVVSCVIHFKKINKAGERERVKNTDRIIISSSYLNTRQVLQYFHVLLSAYNRIKNPFFSSRKLLKILQPKRILLFLLKYFMNMQEKSIFFLSERAHMMHKKKNGFQYVSCIPNMRCILSIFLGQK